jgi:TolB protein
MNADGTNQNQLTTDVHNDVFPSVTPDVRYVVFYSNRTGADHIWRMDIDGGNQKQLTFGAVERYPNCSADSKWVLYQAWESGKPTIWKVSIEGGTPEEITDVSCSAPAVSHDGRLIACMPVGNQRLIFPFEGRKPIIALDLPNKFGYPVWTPDGRSLTFLDSHDGVVNFWLKPLDGSPPKQLTNFKSDQKGALYGAMPYAWSPNGRDLAYARYETKSDILLIRDLK